jgi:hypothetical protein
MAACTPPEELVGYGALLQYYNNLTSAWVTVGGTKDLEYPEDTRIPSLLSTLNEVTYTLNYRWSQYTVLRGIKENRDVLEWRVVLMNPEQTYIKFCAFISSLSVAIPMEELIEFDLTLNPTGAPELGELV